MNMATNLATGFNATTMPISTFDNNEIGFNVQFGKNVKLGSNVRIYDHSIIGDNCVIGDNVIIGHPFIRRGFDTEETGSVIGEGAVIRSGSIIYGGTVIGDNFDCGHNVLVRENSKIGDDVYLLPDSKINADVKIGNYVRLYGFICNRAVLEDGCSVMGDLVHKYNKGQRGVIEPSPVIKAGAIVGMRALVIGGVEIGESSFVGGGAIVTKDVEPGKLFVGKQVA